jgi:hypothetical protein
MMAVAIFQAGIAICSEGMRAKANYLGLVRLTARFDSVGKVRADCGQSEGKYTESREKSLTLSICIPFTPGHHPSPSHAALPASLEKSARSGYHARAVNAVNRSARLRTYLYNTKTMYYR